MLTNKPEVPVGIPEAVIKPYTDGEQTPSDIPAFRSEPELSILIRIKERLKINLYSPVAHNCHRG